MVNNAAELFIVSRDMAEALNSTLKILRWTSFESWLSVNKHALLEVQLRRRARPRGGLELQAADYVRATFIWHLYCPPWPLLEDCYGLCLYFHLGMTEEFARDFRIPKMTQAVFYAMVLNDAVELRVTSRDVADALTSVLESLNWEEQLAGEIVVEGTVFTGAPEHSNIQDGPSTHFPNPKVVASLKRMALEEKYLLPLGYKFIIHDVDCTLNKPPSMCIAIYQVAFSYDVRFLLRPNKRRKSYRPSRLGRPPRSRLRLRTSISVRKRGIGALKCKHKSKKPLAVPLNLPPLGAHKHLHTKTGQDTAVVSVPTPLRTGPPTLPKARGLRCRLSRSLREPLWSPRQTPKPQNS
ncbi:hypothetical protein Cgig2_025390 [Carnegiea gigantea]|uniref:Uncharacterized protein n=1 Tax=Carnegiea gigantea TaxID=171969 RepID=A0A9Q1JLH1_9CARY|nr:hypothetical protein Cgig2_025390 [Carnegiea gigantea]